MKAKKIVFIFFTVFFYHCISAQNSTVIHPTVDRIKATYISVPSGTVTATSGKPDIKVRSEAAITLKSLSGISKIYLKIVNKADNSVLYQVNYNINSGVLINSQGVRLFERNNLLIYIGNPNVISLDTYSYQIITEDPAGNQTTAFISVQ